MTAPPAEGPVRREREVAADRRAARSRRTATPRSSTSRSRGDSTEAKDRVEPALAAVAAAQARHPDLDVEQIGDASANKAVNETISDDLKKAGELSLPVTLIILIITFGTLVAAGVPLLIGLTSVLAALGLVATPEPDPAGRRQPARR